MLSVTGARSRRSEAICCSQKERRGDGCCPRQPVETREREMSFQTICEASRGAFEWIRACYLLGQVVPSICPCTGSSPMWTASCSQRCTDRPRTGMIEGLRRVSLCLPVNAEQQRQRQTLPKRRARLIEGGMKEVGSTRAHRASCTWRVDSSRIQRVIVSLRPRTLAANIMGLGGEPCPTASEEAQEPRVRWWSPPLSDRAIIADVREGVNYGRARHGALGS